MPTWNWQLPGWPTFTYEASALAEAEASFLRETGVVIGAYRHLDEAGKDLLRVELISTEALKTSAIEGEILDRESVQSSVRRQFGLESGGRPVPPPEQGIAEIMVDLYRHFDQALSHDTLFEWHRSVSSGRRDLRDVGRYRTGEHPMQVVSGPIHRPRIHFEAPPSDRLPSEMDAFLDWFNGSRRLPPLARCGIAHLYFECIHPFEDGNGRIGRAIAEKALAQGIGQPSLIALASQIEQHRRQYYEALEAANKTLEVSAWLNYFSNVVLEAQQGTQAHIQFLIEKTRFHDRLRDKLNDRQQRVIERLFRAGPDGFKGGLSAQNYMTIARTSPATATRDLRELVEIGALVRTGKVRHTRYWLNLPGRPPAAGPS